MRQRFMRAIEIQQKSHAPFRFQLEWSKWLWSAAIIRTRFFAAEGLDYIDRFKHYKWLKVTVQPLYIRTSMFVHERMCVRMNSNKV